MCVSLQFVQLRRSTTQTKNFTKAVVNMADAVRRLHLKQNYKLCY